MKVSISTRHGELTPSTQDTIKNKVQKLTRFFDRITGIDVLVDLEASQGVLAEVKVSAEETDDFFAADSAANAISAVERVVQKLEQQLRKHKEKLTAHRGKPSKNVGADSN